VGNTTCNFISGSSTGSGEVYHNTLLYNPVVGAPSDDKAYTGYGWDYNGWDWGLHSDQPDFFRHDRYRQYFNPGLGNTGCTGPMQFAINYDGFNGSQPSKWAVAAVLIYDRLLSLNEVLDVSCRACKSVPVLLAADTDCCCSWSTEMCAACSMQHAECNAVASPGLLTAGQ
jgi:hypothetical protein